MARELELGPLYGLNHMLLALQLGKDGHDDLANCGPWAFPKALCLSVWSTLTPA